MSSSTIIPSASIPVVLAIFALTYIGIAIGRVPGLKLDRTGIALLGAIAIMVFTGLPTSGIAGFINWPTILLLFGFFVISAQLRLSGFFDRIAGRVSTELESPARFLLLLMVVTAGLSAFLNHDIVCFVFAPVVGSATLRRQLNPIPFLVALAVASNIGAAATFVGNPQDMLIAQVAGLGFGPYVLWCLPPVLFALATSYAIIWWLSRLNLASSGKEPEAPAFAPQPFNRPHTIKGLVILIVVIALFFTGLPKEIIALTAAGVHLASRKFRTEDLLGLVDWPILILFMGLFVVTGAFQSTGYGELAVQWLAHNGMNLRSLADPRHRYCRAFQSDKQLCRGNAAGQTDKRDESNGRLRAGTGEQFRGKPHHSRQRLQHHRGAAGAGIGNKHILSRLCTAGSAGDARRAGRTARMAGNVS